MLSRCPVCASSLAGRNVVADIIHLSTSPASDLDQQSFDQQKFNSRAYWLSVYPEVCKLTCALHTVSVFQRVTSTQAMLASVEVMALNLDAAIVSSNSNLGRFAMLRGGQERLDGGVRVRPFDIYFFPTQWKVIYPGCDGTISCPL